MGKGDNQNSLNFDDNECFSALQLQVQFIIYILIQCYN